MHLPYSKRSENIINRKIRKFYIETISKKILNSPNKIYFFRPKKIGKKNWKNRKYQISKNRFAWILYQISKEFHLISSCRAPDHEKSEKCDFFRTEIWHPNFPKNIGHWKLVKTHQYQPLQTRTASRTNFLYGQSFFLGSAVSKISKNPEFL